jgi:hypothetical protein
MNLHLQVAIIALDPTKRISDQLFRTFKPLKIDVCAAHQRARDAIADVSAPRVHQDAT